MLPVPFVGAIDFTTLTSGLITQVEASVTAALPVLAVIIAATVAVSMIRKFTSAK